MIIGAVLAAALAAAAPIRSTEPGRALITNPEWREIPDAEVLAAVYPKVAVMLELEGRALIECFVNEVGRLEACEIITETPAGMGFGPAAMAMSTAFQMNPRMVNGRPTTGVVRIPIRFQLPGEDDEVEQPSKSTPDAERLKAAGRVVTLLGAEDRMFAALHTAFDGTDGLDVETMDEAKAKDLLQINVDLRQQYIPRMLEQLTTSYAEMFTAEELAAFGTFLELPAGKSFWNGGARFGQTMGERAVVIRKAMLAEMRDRFCAKHECSDAPAESAAESPPANSPTSAPPP